MDELVFTYASVDDAIRQLDLLGKMASGNKTIQSNLNVSCSGSSEELLALAQQVAAFATALEKEIAAGATWLRNASADFEWADESSASKISSVGGGN